MIEHAPKHFVLDVYKAILTNESPGREEEVWEIQEIETGETVCYATSFGNAGLIIQALAMLQ